MFVGVEQAEQHAPEQQPLSKIEMLFLASTVSRFVPAACYDE
jgi:hypothetical protein